MSSYSRTILVVGYPKSGNTWLARLIAELLKCPVKGFWGEAHNDDIAIEGLQRKSSLQVFKAHQPFSGINKQITKGLINPRKMIYIVRDVRDIVISGANFFNFPPNDIITRLIQTIPTRGYNPIINQLNSSRRKNLITEHEKIKEMIRTLSQGNKLLPWCTLPWDEHVQSYLEQSVLFVRYEDLLSQPFLECRRILAHLGMPTDMDKIKTAVKAQSFNFVKQKFQAHGDLRRVRFMKQGKNGVWRQKLSTSQKKFLSKRFHHILSTLGYTSELSN